jgi:hypothetical protein
VTPTSRTRHTPTGPASMNRCGCPGHPIRAAGTPRSGRSAR